MQCDICEIQCRIEEGGFGRCKMYTRQNNEITECFANQFSTLFPISIETVPTLHFYPNHKFLQVSSIGCNLSCPGCISEILVTGVRTLQATLKTVPVAQVIQKALNEECKGLVFCINDPSVSFHTFLNLAKQAKASGLNVGFSSNGYLTRKALDQLIPYIDFVNIGVKGFTDEAYRDCGAPSVHPVLRNLTYLYENHIHVEVSAIHMKGCENDIRQIAEFTAALSQDIPFQVMRFIPFGEAEIDREPSILEAEILCATLKKTLNYVYLFNAPGTDQLNTACPECGAILINREFFGPMGARNIQATPVMKTDTRCACGARPAITGSYAEKRYDEHGFLGGYRTTRAFEMLHAILVAIGANDTIKVSKLWHNLIKTDYLREFHHTVQLPERYGDIIDHLSKQTGQEEIGARLKNHINERLEFITSRTKDVERPTVYYAMGYPLFALNAERFETNLVEAAGGSCPNKTLTRKGKPGVTISKEVFRQLNPEIIFISGFLSCPLSDFHDYCIKHELMVTAVQNNRIYDHFPLWDFGSPRWILGLMYIANTLHPERFCFDMEKEADLFYTQFFNKPFTAHKANRSFYRV